MPTCCRELADRSGAVAWEPADRIAVLRMRKPHVRSTAVVFPAQGSGARPQSGAVSGQTTAAGSLSAAGPLSAAANPQAAAGPLCAAANPQAAAAGPLRAAVGLFPPAVSDTRNTSIRVAPALGIILLTALSCRRTFADSAVRKASLSHRRSVPH